MIKKFFTQKKLNIIYSFTAIILMWLIWLTAYYAVGNKLIVPSFLQTLSEFFGYFGKGKFWLALVNSLLRTLIAFVISFSVALICCAATAVFSGAKAFFSPIMAVIRTLPTMAVILLILKFTYNNRTLSPVIVTVLVLLPMIYSQLCTSVEGIDSNLTEMAEVYGVNRSKRLLSIYLPQLLPDIISQTGSNLSLGLKVMISAEVLASTANGLGGMMQINNVSGEIACLAALTLSAVLAGLVIDFSFSLLQRLTCKWTKKE